MNKDTLDKECKVLEKRATDEMGPRTFTAAQLQAAVDGWLAGYCAAIKEQKRPVIYISTGEGTVMLEVSETELERIKRARGASQW